MRWFVQVSTIGKKAPADKLCLEGPHWQAALLAARKQRDEAPGLAGLSVEFDGAGCVAIDPATRTRYQVEPAPDDAPLVAAGAPAAVAPAATPLVAAPEVAPAPPAETPPSKRRARGKTVAFSSAGAVKAAQTEGAAAAPGTAAPAIVAPPAPAAAGIAPVVAAAP
ncbi:MAG: hypothetical protein IT373_21195, partial [Polyangiaceae bacterium]|nr:hypothetical protein [Polyangiaceae bacterium]